MNLVQRVFDLPRLAFMAFAYRLKVLAGSAAAAAACYVSWSKYEKPVSVGRKSWEAEISYQPI